jgi:hypothetical protein
VTALLIELSVLKRASFARARASLFRSKNQVERTQNRFSVSRVRSVPIYLQVLDMFTLAAA